MFSVVLSESNEISDKLSNPVKLNNPTRKIDRVKKRLTELFSNSSAIGLAHIFRSNCKTIKLVWLTFLILSSCACAFYTVKIITGYLKFGTVTTISVINEQQAQFPTVSFCLFPYFNKSLDKIIINADFEKENLGINSVY